MTNFGIFDELLSTQNVNVARIARNVECDFLTDFQTQCQGLDEDEEIAKMRKSRPQFDVMRGLSVLGITLQTFREVSSKGDKARLRSLLNEALFVKTKEVDKIKAKDPEADTKRHSV